MTIRPIVICGEPVLHQPTRPVTEFGTTELETLIQDMFETNEAAHGAGLAANQIGDDRRLFIYDCPDHGTRRRGYIINPTIETSPIPTNMPDPDDDSEGCLSVPGENFPTGRADWARVKGFDSDGEPIEVEGTGFFARCLQHETDHLDGYLYIDRLIGKNQGGPQGGPGARLGGARAVLAARHRPRPVRPLTPARRHQEPEARGRSCRDTRSSVGADTLRAPAPTG